MKKLLPFLLSLLLLFSLAVPALAGPPDFVGEPENNPAPEIDPYGLLGIWVFNELCSTSWFGVKTFNVNFTSNNEEFIAMLPEGQPNRDDDGYILDFMEYQAFDAHNSVDVVGGAEWWADPIYRIVNITDVSRLTNPDEFAVFMKSSAVKQGDSPAPVDPPSTYTTTINFYDNTGSELLYSISEAAEGICPQVTLTCNGNSVDFSGDGISQQPFRSAYPLAGFASSAGSSNLYLPVGGTLTVGGQAAITTVNLYVVKAAPFTTTVNFYDNTGSDLLYSFSESADYACPEVTLTCNGNSVYFSGEDRPPFYSGYELVGFANSAGSAEPYLVVGETLTVGGQASDTTVNLYAIPASLYTITINIFDNAGENLLHSFVQEETYENNLVRITAMETGCTFDGVNDSSFSHTGKIDGFAQNPGSSEISLAVGETQTIGGQRSDFTVNLYIVTLPDYTTTIKIYDNSGKTLLYTYSEAGHGRCPAVIVNVTSTGCTFDGLKFYTWASTYEIAGLTDVAGSTDLVLEAGGASGYFASIENDWDISLFVVEPAEAELGFLDRIWKGISSIPKRIVELLKPAWLRNIWDTFDFSFVTDFFSEAYDAATHGFYLEDYFTGESSIFGVSENHPFAWLRGD